jgi:hypothetical protein
MTACDTLRADMATPQPADGPTLAEAVHEARAILARAEALDAMPPAVRDAEANQGIYAADRDVAVELLAIFVAVIERLDPEMVAAVRDLERLEREIERKRRR